MIITDEDIKNKYVDTLERIQGQKLKYMTKETIFRIFYNVEIKNV